MTIREGIRAATEQDLQNIVALHARVYQNSNSLSLQRRAIYMDQVLMRHPWRTDSLPSLMYQDRAGRIIGSLGVTPRPMPMQERPIHMAVSHHFMVDPQCTATLAGVSLMRAFLAGRQDLSMCETASPVVRKIWKTRGGTASPLQNLHWTWPIRPAAYLAYHARRRGCPAPVTFALTPGLPAARHPGQANAPAVRAASPARSVHGRPLPRNASAEFLDEFSRDCALRPLYDADSLGWLLRILADKKGLGAQQGAVARAEYRLAT